MIYPIPQKNNLTGAPVEINSISVSGDFTARAESVFADYNLPCSGGYSVVINCVNNIWILFRNLYLRILNY